MNYFLLPFLSPFFLSPILSSSIYMSPSPSPSNFYLLSNVFVYFRIHFLPFFLSLAFLHRIFEILTLDIFRCANVTSGVRAHSSYYYSFSSSSGSSYSCSSYSWSDLYHLIFPFPSSSSSTSPKWNEERIKPSITWEVAWLP